VTSLAPVMAPSIPRQHTGPGLFIAFTVLASIAVNVNATCYWPNATLFTNNPDPDTISPDDHPCNPDAEASVCCGTGWTCLSDGVCKIRQDGNDFYYRGTCTDFTWKSQSCPGFCMQQSEPFEPFELSMLIIGSYLTKPQIMPRLNL
jgi:hypothetical protein